VLPARLEAIAVRWIGHQKAWRHTFHLERPGGIPHAGDNRVSHSRGARVLSSRGDRLFASVRADDREWRRTFQGARLRPELLENPSRLCPLIGPALDPQAPIERRGPPGGNQGAL